MPDQLSEWLRKWWFILLRLSIHSPIVNQSFKIINGKFSIMFWNFSEFLKNTREPHSGIWFAQSLCKLLLFKMIVCFPSLVFNSQLRLSIVFVFCITYCFKNVKPVFLVVLLWKFFLKKLTFYVLTFFWKSFFVTFFIIVLMECCLINRIF